MLRRALLSLLVLLCAATGAAAQQFPTNLPQNTVYGRLGIGPGPGQAIPFATLLANLNGVAWAGVARMIPRPNQTTSASDCWNLTDPFGNAIACTTSTTSQGLQEFFNAATANGWPAVIDCGGIQFPSHLQPVFIEATATVTVPVVQDWSFHSYGCALNSNVATAPALIIDSEGASVFDWDDRIIYNPTAPNGNTTINPSCSVLIKPTTHTADGFAGLYAGYFRIKNPAVQSQGGTTATAAVCIDTSAGSTIQERLDFTEINSTQTAYFGLFAFNASGSTGLQQNQFFIQQVHGATLYNVEIGYNGVNGANYYGNYWNINNIQGMSSSTRGIDTWGSYDIFDIGVINNQEGGLGIGIATNAGIATASVNASGSGYGTSVSGTMTWSGSGCPTNPVLNVSTNSSGQISTVNSIPNPGACTTFPSSSATTWTPGGGLSAGSNASFTMVASGSFNKFRAGNITGYSTNNYSDTGTCNQWEIGPAASGGSNGSVLALFGGTSGCTQIKSAAASSGLLTVPSATDTLVGRATTDTLTNKTLTSPVISTIVNTGTLTLPTSTDTLVGRATTDVLTNKTYDTAGTGNVFKINGTQITAISGTGSVAMTTSPSFTTPALGAATATSLVASSTVTGGGLISSADPGGTSSTTTLSNANSTTISTGTGTVKMSSSNSANSAVWIKVYVGTTTYWVPGWTTNSP